MQVRSLEAKQFLNDSITGIVLDVRSPAEYKVGHIPGAISFPLFTDEERKEVGILYKQQGREPAIEKGLEFVGPKMKNFVKHAREFAEGKPVYVHCWRGGMRSGSMAWLLSTAGLNVFTLAGGYKRYRKHILQELTRPFSLVVLGGETGSGKTEVLHELRRKGEQVVDLEALANHKGSSFGSIGQEPQPGSEHFGNLLYRELQRLDRNKRTWVEDESRMIGTVNIPEEFYVQMMQSPLLVMQVPVAWRIKHLVEGYGQADRKLLIAAFERIRKKIGGQYLNAAIEAIGENKLDVAAEIALKYYDKAYRFGLQTKTNPWVVYYEPGENKRTVMADDLMALAQNNLKTWIKSV